MKRTKKVKTIHVGKIDAMTLFKAAQPWMGNQRSLTHKSEKDYSRKAKHPNKEYE